jgi:predicted nucleic acid-binding protein
MRVLFDTNIILDFLEKRAPFNEAADRLFEACDKTIISGFIAAQSIADIFYILRKDYSVEERKNMLLGICELLIIVGSNSEQIIAALTNEDFTDLEDCIQTECAKSINAAYIITRNIEDFTASPVPAILPEDFLVMQGNE